LKRFAVKIPYHSVSTIVKTDTQSEHTHTHTHYQLSCRSSAGFIFVWLVFFVVTYLSVVQVQPIFCSIDVQSLKQKDSCCHGRIW